MNDPNTVLDFWFKEISSQQWWSKSDSFDASIAARFGALHAAAVHNELFSWRETANGCLAEIIILDQFSRNIYRDRAGAFACDAQALALAQTAVAAQRDAELEPVLRSFLYMPYMHSESLLIHQHAQRLFSAPNMENNLRFELKHKEIIERFGRYPHRNAILGRQSSPQERTFLQGPGSSF